MKHQRLPECQVCFEAATCEQSKRQFLVVFEGVGEENDGNYLGVRTIVDYVCEPYLQAKKDRKELGNDKIVAMGYSMTESRRLCDAVPIETLYRAVRRSPSFEDSELRDHELRNVDYLAGFRARQQRIN